MALLDISKAIYLLFPVIQYFWMFRPAINGTNLSFFFLSLVIDELNPNSIPLVIFTSSRKFFEFYKILFNKEDVLGSSVGIKE